MDVETVNKLLAVNHKFYQKLAQPFSATRQRLQPGVQQIIQQVNPHERILDLGCGNGELALALARQGHQGDYIGIDSSVELIHIARQRSATISGPVFLNIDLSLPEWPVHLHNMLVDNYEKEARPAPAYDWVFAFAVLHHLPSAELRLRTIQAIHDLLAPTGFFAHSAWQFLSSPRLRQRILPWETIGSSIQEVDEGDYLLDWRHEQYGFRYVHLFSEKELHDLASAADFRVLQTFYADGEGSRLGLYQIWALTSE